jgi:hypothetical protein
MLPAERHDVSEKIVTDPFSIGAQFSNGVAEIDRISKDDGRDDEIDRGCPTAPDQRNSPPAKKEHGNGHAGTPGTGKTPPGARGGGA